MEVRIYSRQYCSYCVRAKHLFDQLGVRYTEIRVDRDPDAMVRMKQESGQRTVPQIWIGTRHIGGCDELMGLHRVGGLAPLLAEAG